MSLSTRAVFVKGLTEDVDDVQLSEYFAKVGKLQTCVVASADEAFVVYEQVTDAKRAVRDFNEREFEGMTLNVYQ